MILVLRVSTYMNEAPIAPIEVRFGQAGGSIGRSPDCDMVLPDTEKRVSRMQSRVHHDGGSFYLSDLGSNPSIVNNQQLSAGQMAKLNHGDQIVMGDFVMIAALLDPADQAFANRSGPALPQSPDPLDFGSPLAPTPDPLQATPDSPPGADPLQSASVLGDGIGLGADLSEHDPLGLTDPRLLPGADAGSGAGFQPVYRGSESDHVPAHELPFPTSRQPVTRQASVLLKI